MEFLHPARPGLLFQCLLALILAQFLPPVLCGEKLVKFTRVTPVYCEFSSAMRVLNVMEAVDRIEFYESLLLTGAVCLWLYWLWSRRNFYIFAFKFPGQWGLPILGRVAKIKSVHKLLQDTGKIFEENQQHTLCTWIGLYPLILSIEPDFIKEILLSPEMLNKAKTFYDPVYKFMCNGGIIASPAEEWQHNRKMINPCFDHKVLLSMFPIFNKNKDFVIAKLNAMVDTGEHKLAEMCQKVSLRTSVETTMGKVMNDNDQVADDLAAIYTSAFKKILTSGLLSFLKLDWLIIFDLENNKIKRTIYSFIDELILPKISKTNIMISHSKENEPICEDAISKPGYIFIDQAIKLYKNKQFSWNDIIAESNTIVAGAFETSANALFSTLVMLAMHPEVQERLYEEIVNVFPDKEFDVQFEHLAQFPYMDMVISEVFRLVPSVPLIGRHVVKDTQLSTGITLPKGMQIFISIFHLHRRTDIWGPNAEKFDPDNFLPANLKGKHPYAYIPFSKGKRNCVGWRYADFALKIILPALIRNYKFTTKFKYEDLVFECNISLKYMHEPMFEITNRQ